jgi:hypothetical protein
MPPKNTARLAQLRAAMGEGDEADEARAKMRAQYMPTPVSRVKYYELRPGDIIMSPSKKVFKQVKSVDHRQAMPGNVMGYCNIWYTDGSMERYQIGVYHGASFDRALAPSPEIIGKKK